MTIARRATRRTRLVAAGLAALAILRASPGRAGPPLITDDPIPTPVEHWEISTPLDLERFQGRSSVVLPGLDANYGATENLQLSLSGGLQWRDPSSVQTRPRLEEVELEAKYRFLELGSEHHRVHAALFPRIVIPADRTWRTLGWTAVDYELPLVWMTELDAGTRAYGDVHVAIAHAPDARNTLFTGVAWEHDVNLGWTLTGEVYSETAGEPHAPGTFGFNAGSICPLRSFGGDTDSGIQLLFSAGAAFSDGAELRVWVGPRFVFRTPGTSR